MAGSECDVCKAPSIGVACSALGAISFAYCQACAAAGCEPYSMLVCEMALFIEGRAAGWLEETIIATLSRLNIPREQFDSDVAEAKAKWAAETCY